VVTEHELQEFRQVVQVLAGVIQIDDLGGLGEDDLGGLGEMGGGEVCRSMPPRRRG
jgi:hypothetical protein